MAIVFQKVSVKYNNHKALENLNLLINEGEFISILGANGSGKTTLMYCINGLIPHAVEADLTGDVTIDEVNTKKSNVGNLARTVGIVFQDPDLMIFNLSVREEVAFGAKNLKLENIDQRVEESLRKVGLLEMIDRDPNTLSGGQKQLVCIASVLAMGTKYMILDEPISHLDYRNSVNIYELLLELNSDGKTIIVVEHDNDFTWDYSKRAIALSQGKVALDGKVEEVMADPEYLKSIGIKPTFKSKIK